MKIDHIMRELKSVETRLKNMSKTKGMHTQASNAIEVARQQVSSASDTVRRIHADGMDELMARLDP